MAINKTLWSFVGGDGDIERLTVGKNRILGVNFSIYPISQMNSDGTAIEAVTWSISRAKP